MTLAWLRRKVRIARGDPDLRRLRERGMRIGERLDLQPGCFIDVAHAELISVGDDVVLAPRVMLVAHDTSMAAELGTRIGRVDIEDRVYIGAGAIVLPGVRIGHDARIGAGSVVSRDVPPMTVAVGAPARPVAGVEDFLARHWDRMRAAPERVWAGAPASAQEREEVREALAAGAGYLSEGFFTGRMGRGRSPAAAAGIAAPAAPPCR